MKKKTTKNPLVKITPKSTSKKHQILKWLTIIIVTLATISLIIYLLLTIFNKGRTFESHNNIFIKSNNITLEGEPIVKNFTSTIDCDIESCVEILNEKDGIYTFKLRGNTNGKYSFEIKDESDKTYTFEYYYDKEQETVIVNLVDTSSDTDQSES